LALNEEVAQTVYARLANTSVDTGSPEHFVEYGSKCGYAPTEKKQCHISSWENPSANINNYVIVITAAIIHSNICSYMI
jgi:hypothetical protein